MKSHNGKRVIRGNIFQTMQLTLIFGLLMGVGQWGVPEQSYAELLRSTSHGLDLSQLHLVVDAPPGHDEELYERARSLLAQAGLFTKSESANTYKQWEPLLRLTFEVEPVGGLYPNTFLYSRRLEIVENVVPERTPKIRAWAVTWSVGSSWPEVRTDQVTIFDLEKDLDKLMRTFLQDYQYANQLLPLKEKE